MMFTLAFYLLKKDTLLSHAGGYFLWQLYASGFEISPGNVQFSGHEQLFLYDVLQFIKQSLDVWFISY